MVCNKKVMLIYFLIHCVYVYPIQFNKLMIAGLTLDYTDLMWLDWFGFQAVDDQGLVPTILRPLLGDGEQHRSCGMFTSQSGLQLRGFTCLKVHVLKVEIYHQSTLWPYYCVFIFKILKKRNDLELFMIL